MLGGLLALRERGSTAGLSAAEQEILRLVQQGLSNRDIAARRGRSERTIANQVSAVLRKTGLGSRRALAARTALPELPGGPQVEPEATGLKASRADLSGSHRSPAAAC